MTPPESAADRPGVDPSRLDGLVPLNAMSDTHRREVAASARLLDLGANTEVGLRDEVRERTLYLLDGALELGRADGSKETVTSEDPGANLPLTQLVPGAERARAVNAVTLMEVDRAQVSSLLIVAQAADDAGANAGGEDWTVGLMRSALFSRIPPAQVRRTFDLMERREIKAGQTVIRQGEPGDYYYVIRSGQCDVLCASRPDATAVKVVSLGPGDGFGEEALVSDAQRNATVVMTTDGTLMRLTKEDFIELIHDPVVSLVSEARAKRLINAGALWLDVRLQDEHRANGLEGSLNVPLAELRERVSGLARDGGYVVYCNTGRRSAAAAFLLAERGIEAWVLAGGLLEGDAPAAGAEESPGDNLESRLLLARAELESALRVKAELDAELAIEEAQSAGSDTDGDVARLEAESKAAEDRLTTARTAKLELEQKLRASEARENAQRRRAEEHIRKLRQEAETRLREEEARLQSEFAQAASELQRIRDAQEQAEAAFEAERRRMEEQMAAARSRMESEAKRIRAELESSRAEAERKAGSIRQEQSQREHRLRESMEERLAEERRHLEREFAESVSQQERAQRALEMAEAAKRTAHEESARLARELEAERLRQQQEEEAARQAEIQRLAAAEAEASAALKTARADREQAESSRRDLHSTIDRMADSTGADPVDTEARLRAELGEFEAKLAEADERIEAAERARGEAEQAQHRVEERLARQQLMEEELRMKIVEETENFLEEERTRSESEAERLREVEAALARVEEEKLEAKRRDNRAAESMMSDILAQLGEDDDTAAAAAEQAELARAAQGETALERERREAALERARRQVDGLGN